MADATSVTPALATLGAGGWTTTGDTKYVGVNYAAVVNRQIATGFFASALAQDAVTTYTPSGVPNQTIAIAGRRQLTYNTSQPLTGAGHVVGGIDWLVVSGTGNVNLGIAHEAKVEVTNAGNVSTAINGIDCQLATQSGTLTVYRGVSNQILANAGVTTNAFMFDAEVPNAIAGTIGTYIGFYQGNLTANNPIGTKITTEGYAYKNEDPNLLTHTVGPLIDNSVSIPAAPITGFALTVPNRVDYWLIFPAATLATGTITMPAVPLDGQELTLWSSQIVTTLTLSFNGKGNFGTMPATMAANTPYRFKFLLALNAWMKMFV